MEKTTRMLDCQLSEEERFEMAIELSNKLAELEKVEAEKKSAATGFKYQEDALSTQISQMGKCVQSGNEEREVECAWMYNSPVRGMKQLIRLDTHEVAAEQDMDGRDNQRVAELNQTRMFEDAKA